MITKEAFLLHTLKFANRQIWPAKNPDPQDLTTYENQLRKLILEEQE